MTSPAQKVSSAYQSGKSSIKPVVLFLLTAVQLCKRLSKTSNLLGSDEFEMLCFLLQINVMHLKHECQFSRSKGTVATVNASNVGTLKTGLQHTVQNLSYGILENTQTKRSACTVCKETGQHRDQAEEGRCLLG